VTGGRKKNYPPAPDGLGKITHPLPTSEDSRQKAEANNAGGTVKSAIIFQNSEFTNLLPRQVGLEPLIKIALVVWRSQGTVDIHGGSRAPKVAADIQDRLGPNRVGRRGMTQHAGDGGQN